MSEHLDLTKLKNQIADFAKEREWEKFHSPKNIAMALTVEASELMELFQWMTEEESRNLSDPEKLKNVGREISDVLIYTVRLAALLGIDIPKVLETKMVENAKKYPVEKSRGHSKKYDQLD
jgi:NTP pyrophosphatase (non-canonical NTP hydrolase)